MTDDSADPQTTQRTEPSFKRRTVLAATAFVGGGVFGGRRILADTATQVDSDGPTAWPQFGRDATNVGTTDDGGPFGDPTTVREQWTVDASVSETTVPLVVDGVVYVATGSGWRAYDAETGEKGGQGDASGTGAVDAAPAVDGETIYVTTTDGVFASDIDSGEQRWTANYPSRSAPTVADGTVYVSANTNGEVYSGENEFLALDAADGSVQWRFETSFADTQSDYATPGISVTPAVANEIVYIPTYDGVYALDAGSGEQIWHSEPAFDRRSSAAVVDGTVYLYGGDVEFDSDDSGIRTETYSSAVHALDAATGDLQWMHDLGTKRTLPMPYFDVQQDEYVPAVADGRVYVTVGSGGSTQGGSNPNPSELLALDAETGELRWRTTGPDRTSSVTSAPVVADGTVYVGGLSLQSGVYERDGDGEIYRDDESADVFAFDAKTGALRGWHWEDDPKDRTSPRMLTPPTVSGDRVYYAKHQRLRAVAPDDGDSSSPSEPTIEIGNDELRTCDPVEFDVTFEDDGDSEAKLDFVYRWDFDGDGEVDELTSSRDVSATRRAYNPGDYEVRLEVRDRYNSTAEATKQIKVDDCDVDGVAIDVVTEEPSVDEPVVFEARAERGGDVTEYRWDFDDDGQDESTRQRATWEFHTAGEYPISLEAAYEDDKVTTATTTISIAGATEDGDEGEDEDDECHTDGK